MVYFLIHCVAKQVFVLVFDNCMLIHVFLYGKCPQQC